MDFLCCCQAKTIVKKKILSFSIFNEEIGFSALFELVTKFNEHSSHQTLTCVYDDSYHMPHFPKCHNSRLWLWNFQPKQIMICKNCNIVTNQSVLCLDIKAFPVYAPGRKQTLFLQCKNTSTQSDGRCHGRPLFTVYILHMHLCLVFIPGVETW